MAKSSDDRFSGFRPLPGVSPQVWDRIQSEAAIREDEQAANSNLNQDAEWVLERVPQDARLLDLGCGSGRLMEMHMARSANPSQGWALGIDLSQAALVAARKKLEEAGMIPRLIRANLVELDFLKGAGLDAAACLFSTLGMIRGEKNRRGFLHGVYQSLRPGGMLLLHAHARWWHLTTRVGRSWLLRDTLNRWLRKEYAGEFRSPTAPAHVPSLGHFSQGELVALIRSAGFKPVELSAVRGEQKDLSRPTWTLWGKLAPAHGWLISAVK